MPVSFLSFIIINTTSKQLKVKKKYSSVLHSSGFVQKDDSFNFMKAQQARTLVDQVKGGNSRRKGTERRICGTSSHIYFFRAGVLLEKI